MRALRLMFILSMATACAQQPAPQSPASRPISPAAMPANSTPAPVVMPPGEAPARAGTTIGAPGVFDTGEGNSDPDPNPLGIGGMEQLPAMPGGFSRQF